MSHHSPAKPSVLLVADTAEVASKLVAAVRDRRSQRSRLTLLVPAVAHGLHRVVDPEDACCGEAERTIRSLRPSIEAVADEAIATIIGSHDPLAAVEDALNDHHFDEIILATRSSRLARILHVDLASKVRALGPPVTVA